MKNINEKEFDETIKNGLENTYGSIHFSLKDKFDIKKGLQKRRHFNKKAIQRTIVAAATTLVVLAGSLGIYSVEGVYASVLYDSDAQVEMDVNYWGEVIDVKPVNEAGEEAAKSLKLKKTKYKDAVKKLNDYEYKVKGEKCASNAYVEVKSNDKNKEEKMISELSGNKNGYVNGNRYAYGHDKENMEENKEINKQIKEEEKIEKETLKEEEKIEKESLKEEEKIEKEASKDEEKASKEELKDEKTSEKVAEKEEKTTEKLAEKEEKDAEKVAEKATKESKEDKKDK